MRGERKGTRPIPLRARTERSRPSTRRQSGFPERLPPPLSPGAQIRRHVCDLGGDPPSGGDGKPLRNKKRLRSITLPPFRGPLAEFLCGDLAGPRNQSASRATPVQEPTEATSPGFSHLLLAFAREGGHGALASAPSARIICPASSQRAQNEDDEDDSDPARGVGPRSRGGERGEKEGIEADALPPGHRGLARLVTMASHCDIMRSGAHAKTGGTVRVSCFTSCRLSPPRAFLSRRVL